MLSYGVLGEAGKQVVCEGACMGGPEGELSRQRGQQVPRPWGQYQIGMLNHDNRPSAWSAVNREDRDAIREGRREKGQRGTIWVTPDAMGDHHRIVGGAQCEATDIFASPFWLPCQGWAPGKRAGTSEEVTCSHPVERWR